MLIARFRWCASLNLHFFYCFTTSCWKLHAVYHLTRKWISQFIIHIESADRKWSTKTNSAQTPSFYAFKFFNQLSFISRETHAIPEDARNRKKIIKWEKNEHGQRHKVPLCSHGNSMTPFFFSHQLLEYVLVVCFLKKSSLLYCFRRNDTRVDVVWSKILGKSTLRA